MKTRILMAVFILVVVAVGAVKFREIRRRGIASEARGLLAGIVSAESAFHTSFGFFEADLAKIGFVPSGRLRNTVGFNPTCPGAQKQIAFEPLFRRLPCPGKTNFVVMAIQATDEQTLSIHLVDRSGFVRNETVPHGDLDQARSAILRLLKDLPQ